MSPDLLKQIVLRAFGESCGGKDGIPSNSLRSSFFVSNLAKELEAALGGKALVQKTDPTGKKQKGEWLLDIAIVKESEILTEYKNRKSKIVDKIMFAVESEFSTSLKEFCVDFAKLLHVRSSAYLYISGLNQETEYARSQYIEAQSRLAKDLINRHEMDNPFFLVFVPTPGGVNGRKSLWDGLGVDELSSWIRMVNLTR